MSVDVLNWYEKQYPSDYRQLVQLKKYPISEMSFLLPRVWSRLDYGQKLLMCAVYNENVALARQLLRPGGLCTAQQHQQHQLINPFWAPNYESAWSRRFSSSSTSTTATETMRSHSPSPYDPFDQDDDDDEDDDEDDETDDEPEYFFNQRIDDVFMHSPFYFSVVLKRANMCAFFVEFMKTGMRADRLDHVLKKRGDLTRLVALALSNQSWDIAG